MAKCDFPLWKAFHNGKTHLAKAIGHEVCRRQGTVLFRTTSTLVQELLDPSQPQRIEKLLKCCLKLDPKEAEILYMVADERLSRSSTILTSNRPPEDWFAIFPDPVIGNAILDRFVSGAIKLIVTKGISYRKEGEILPSAVLTTQEEGT